MERNLPAECHRGLTVFRGRVPAVIDRSGEPCCRRFLEFFAAQIRNRGTRAAYARAVVRFFDWCDAHRVELGAITPLVVAAYIEDLTRRRTAPTVKLHLAAIRMLFDFLVTGQILPLNPAASVRGPKHVVKKGKTPVLTADEARQLLLIKGAVPGSKGGFVAVRPAVKAPVAQGAN